MRRVIGHVFCLAAVVLGIQGGAVQALILRSEQSFELVVRDADCVVIGEILRQEVVASPSPRFTSAVPWRHVTVKVEEGFVGKPANEISYFEPDVGPYYLPVPKIEPGTPGIFVLVDGKRYAVADRWRKAEPIYGDVEFTTPAKWEAMGEHVSPAWLLPEPIAEIPSMQLRRFRSAEAVIAAARAYSVRPVRSTDVETVETPFRIWEGNQGGWAPITTVPADEAADALAKTWSAWKDDTMAWNAVRVAQRSKTRDHIEILQKVGARPVANEYEDATRAVALSKLQDWSQPVDWTRRGVVRMDPKINLALALISVVAVLIAPSWYLYGAERASRRRRATVAAWLAVLGCIAVFWVRSYGPTDAIEMGRWEAGVVSGSLYFVFSERWFDAGHRGGIQVAPAAAFPNLIAAEEEYFPLDDRLGLMTGHINDSGQLTEGGWYWTCAIRFPLGILALVWMLPVCGVVGLRKIRRSRARRRRGFEVLIAGKGDD